MSRVEIKESAGTIRNHEEKQYLHALQGPKERPWGSLGRSSGTSEIQGSTAVDPSLPGSFWIPLALMAMLLGTSNSSWAIPGAPLRALGYLSGGLGGHGGPLGDVSKPPERVQSNFKIIEKPLVFIAFLSIGVIWYLSGGSQAAFWGPREVLLGVDVAQREVLGAYFRCLQKHAKGQRPLTFRGWGVNGR